MIFFNKFSYYKLLLFSEEKIKFSSNAILSALSISVGYFTLLATWIFIKKVPLYLPMSTDDSIKFWLCVDGALFMVTLEKIYTKIWLKNRIKIEAIHSLDIDWSGKIKDLQRMERENWEEQTKHITNEDDKRYLEEKLRAPIKSLVMEEIFKVIKDRNKENRKEKNFYWFTHPSFQLFQHFLGLLGSLFLLYDRGFQKIGLRFIGIFCLISRSIFFYIFDGFYFFHCFFYKIYNNSLDN